MRTVVGATLAPFKAGIDNFMLTDVLKRASSINVILTQGKSNKWKIYIQKSGNCKLNCILKL